MPVWIRVDAGFDSHPKAIAAGKWGRRAAMALWRAAKIHGKRGVLSAAYATGSWLADFTRDGQDDAENYQRGIADAILARLVHLHDDGSIEIHDWDGYQWDDGAAERMRRYRDKNTIPNERNERNATDVTGVTATPPHPTPPQPHPTKKEGKEGSSEPPAPPVQPALPGMEAEQDGSGDRANGKARAIFDYWKEKLGHPQARLDGKRRRRIEWALKQYDEAMVRKAIDGCAASAWHRGENPEHRVYDDVALILRDAEHVERFAAGEVVAEVEPPKNY